MSRRQKRSRQQAARRAARTSAQMHARTALAFPIVPANLPVLRGRYDAAQTTDENRRHWANADALSASAANSLDVRRTVRNRARYEVANNCYLSGMVQTLANDCIGTGPRLQLLTQDSALNNRIEAMFEDWAREVHLASKLRTMRHAKAVDGEVFAVLTSNRRIESPVKLDVQLVECDRVTSPWPSMTAADIDGIRFDAFDNPVEYCVLRNHPGDLACDTSFDWRPAEYVIHWFKPTRPGQQRGISEIMAALPLSAILRRYTLAVLAAAETAANFAAVLHTDAPADDIADEGRSQLEFELKHLVPGKAIRLGYTQVPPCVTLPGVPLAVLSSTRAGWLESDLGPQRQKAKFAGVPS